VDEKGVAQMVDVVLVLVVLAFFGLCVLYVRGCDRMIRSDGVEATADSEFEREVTR
jgi:hypothetical protein